MRHQIRRLVSGFLFIFILLVTVLMSPFDGQTVEGNDEKGTWSYWENQILLQKPAANAYNELMEYFEVEYGYEGDDIKYPQDFGGAYIDEQNKLVIQLKDYSNQASYQSIFTYTDDVEFQKVQYSYNELALYSSKVAASFSNEADITGYGIDVINNQISVNVTQPNDVQLIANRAEKLLSTDYNSEISFSYDPAPELTSELWGGDAIRNLNTASYTMAIGGYWNGNPAILTAGHANSQYNRIYYSPTESMIGTVVLQHFDTPMLKALVSKECIFRI